MLMNFVIFRNIKLLDGVLKFVLFIINYYN